MLVQLTIFLSQCVGPDVWLRVALLLFGLMLLLRKSRTFLQSVSRRRWHSAVHIIVVRRHNVSSDKDFTIMADVLNFSFLTKDKKEECTGSWTVVHKEHKHSFFVRVCVYFQLFDRFPAHWPHLAISPYPQWTRKSLLARVGSNPKSQLRKGLENGPTLLGVADSRTIHLFFQNQSFGNQVRAAGLIRVIETTSKVSSLCNTC